MLSLPPLLRWAAVGVLISLVSADNEMFFDDVSPAFSWSGTDWSQYANDSLGMYGDSMHWSNNLGAMFTFTFPIAGTGFRYIGMQRSDGGNYSLCVDCPGTPTYSSSIPPYSDFVDALNTSATPTDKPIVLYELTGLPVGNHTVQVTDMYDRRMSRVGQITVDAFVVLYPNGTTASSSLSSTSSSTSSPTPTPQPGPASTTYIAAGVGAFVALLVVAAAVLCFRRRSRRSGARFLGVDAPPSKRRSGGLLYALAGRGTDRDEIEIDAHPLTYEPSEATPYTYPYPTESQSTYPSNTPSAGPRRNPSFTSATSSRPLSTHQPEAALERDAPWPVDDSQPPPTYSEVPQRPPLPSSSSAGSEKAWRP